MPASRSGLLWGFVGVLAFSLTVPLTRVAVAGLSPLFIGAGRAAVPAVLAAVLLLATRSRRPRGRQWARVGVVALGVVLGFPLLTSYALTQVPAAHGAVVIAILPAATAVIAALRARERPPVAFWVLAATGAAAAVGFAAASGVGVGGLQWADVLLFGAVLAAATAYAEGGMLARELGSWQTICWALVVGFPLMSALAVVGWVQQPPTAGAGEWASFAYLALVSMFLGFFAWYRGLGIGPMAQVSQVQLVQPVLSLVWAALLLGEELTVWTVLGGLVVIVCAALAVQVRLRPPSGSGRAA
jgi:Predicted membrane protein